MHSVFPQICSQQHGSLPNIFQKGAPQNQVAGPGDMFIFLAYGLFWNGAMAQNIQKQSSSSPLTDKQDIEITSQPLGMGSHDHMKYQT